jgi:hypothetical protein
MGIFKSFLNASRAARAASAERAKADKIITLLKEATEKIYENAGAVFGPRAEQLNIPDIQERVARDPAFIEAVQGVDAIVTRVNAAFHARNTDYELTLAGHAAVGALDNLSEAMAGACMRALLPDDHAPIS